MSRTLKRVPLDFAWPFKKVWGGYLNPFYRQRAECACCEGTGYAAEAKLFVDQWYGKASFDPREYGATPLTMDHPSVQALAEHNCTHAPGYYGSNAQAVQREARRLFDLWKGMWCHHLIQADVDALIAARRLMDFTHVPRTAEQHEIVRAKMAAGGNSWLPESNGYVPTADEVNAWSMKGFGHDGINESICVKARCEREGFILECTACKGEGAVWPSEEIKHQYETWERVGPPSGDGYQLWETTSEGSPMSPVFASIDELCEWCASNATTFGSARASAKAWREMLDADFVHHREGSMVFL